MLLISNFCFNTLIAFIEHSSCNESGLMSFCRSRSHQLSVHEWN